MLRGEHFTLDEGETVADKLMHELGRPDYFNSQIEQAFIVVDSPATLVPLEEFRRDETRAFYELTHKQADAMNNKRAAYTIMPHLEMVEIYAIECDVEEAILQYYPTARFFGPRAMLMERLFQYNSQVDASEMQLYCHMQHNSCSLFAYNDNGILFANTFDAGSVADTTFFILNTWQQLQLNALEDTLVMFNDNYEPIQELQKELAAYLQNIETHQQSELFSNAPLSREQQVPLQLKALLLNRV